MSGGDWIVALVPWAGLACGRTADAPASAAPAERAPAPANAGEWSPALLVHRTKFDPEVIWPHAGSICLYDAQAGLLLPPDHVETWPWPEHPSGKVEWRTNNLGLLESAPTVPEKQGLRIFLTGDSHLMSVWPEESFPNVFEAELRAAGYEGCEVLNSGIGYTGPRLYLRRIERFLELDPDVVIVSFFAGNDFWDDVFVEYDMKLSTPPRVDPAYHERLKKGMERHHGALYQGLNQAYFFKHWPGMADLSLDMALSTLDEIQALCRREDIELFVVFLPTKVDVDIEDEPEVRAAALATLELSEEEAAINVRLTERAVRALGERGIPTLDPTAAMRADPRPFYWRKDHHLAVAGSAFVAEAMFGAFEPLLRKWKPAR